MTNDRPLVGILLMIGFCAVAPLGDSIAKLLGETIPLFELLVVRFAAQVVFLLPIVWWSGTRLALPGYVMRLTVLRTALHITGIGAMFMSLRYLPLADAVAIAFVMPFIMLAFGKFFLGEAIGPRRLAACTVGFIGTLLVVQPNLVTVGAPALLPLVVAFAFSGYMLVTRKISRVADPIALQVVSGIYAVIGFAAVAFINLGFDLPQLRMVQPDLRETLLLIASGFFGTFGHLLMTWSLRFAPSATVAPIQYLEIPFATVIGWLIFRDLPNGLAALGIAITIGAGLYIVFRERAIARDMQAQPLPDAQ
ncbi:DMT family transporter [Nitratireductor aquimarinus]|uniref:DMT family transporter n=1 Tax=Alphaproteobacteria TaxID=28211 RepID=UPI0019D3A388|nr:MULTISPECIES: DMT family transporter [Alphaproteobacteria]MBN7758917.1 DMT family transporter [Nitratireductor aquimarinus]MBY6001918.1 DMT family transporter [Tritonibacter mobilis]MBY6024203.1 DMT family transporter [Nitratireductor sp. DP7N14-4]